MQSTPSFISRANHKQQKAITLTDGSLLIITDTKSAEAFTVVEQYLIGSLDQKQASPLLTSYMGELGLYNAQIFLEKIENRSVGNR